MLKCECFFYASAGAQDTAPPDPHNHRRVRQGDTNVITVKFDKLISPSNMHAGDAQSCTQCGAILSALSKLSPEGDQKVSVNYFKYFYTISIFVSFKFVVRSICLERGFLGGILYRQLLIKRT